MGAVEFGGDRGDRISDEEALIMLMLLVELGDDRYALDVTPILEIVPLVQFKQVHQAPDYVLGVFNYQGTIIPAVDLNQLLRGVSSRFYLSSRILVLGTAHRNNATPLIGLVAEQVKETLEISQSSYVNSASNLEQTSYLGPMIVYQQEMIQCLELDPFLGLELKSSPTQGLLQGI
jgi:chemotaxis-related protein WspB